MLGYYSGFCWTGEAREHEAESRADRFLTTFYQMPVAVPEAGQKVPILQAIPNASRDHSAPQMRPTAGDMPLVQALGNCGYYFTSIACILFIVCICVCECVWVKPQYLCERSENNFFCHVGSGIELGSSGSTISVFTNRITRLTLSC